MKTFLCACGNTLHFENTCCLGCGRRVGFLPEAGAVVSCDVDSDGVWLARLDDGERRRVRGCRNDLDFHVCNWLVPFDEGREYCVSCRLNCMVPDLTQPRNVTLWFRVEAAKRRLIYSLLRMRLPFEGRDRNAQGGLGFQFLADPDPGLEFVDEFGPRDRILTGHGNGLITINLAEADHIARELMREQMNEEYRTLLGHFRHESGHYFWDRLVRDGGRLDEFRSVFGDERRDYASALGAYYESGPPPDWRQNYISAYSASHPWEDWAETWAHYLHMVDTLETAADFGFAIGGAAVQSAEEVQLSLDGFDADTSASDGFSALVADWMALTTAMNAINRSMGLADVYPFTFGAGPTRKLSLVHALVQCAGAPK
jgi:hypothetical protein